MSSERQTKLIQELTKSATELMKEWPPSRTNQRSFVLEFVANGFTNASEAARNAGYSEKSATTTASKMLAGTKKFQHIPPIIEQLKNEFDERHAEMKIADGTEVLQYLTELMRGEHKEQVLRGVGMGEQVKTNMEVSAKDRIKAAELLGKRHALFTDKVDLNTGDIVIKVGEWDDDED